MEMLPFRLSEHPIWGRVLARHRRARGVGFADDSYIYAALKAALKEGWSRFANGLERTRNCVST